MTTQDPRYKHKPSEKHTLEEVLKSLQDLIRNDLPGEKSAGHTSEPLTGTDRGAQKPQIPDGQKPARESFAPVREDFAPVNPAAGPVNLDAVMRSLKDLIGNELDVGDQPVREDDLAPPLPEADVLESAAEELAPLHEEPTLEDADELVPGNEPASPEENLTPPLPEDDLLKSALEELAPLHQEPIFEEPDELIPGDESASPAEDLTPPLPEENILHESAADEFAPRQEEPTFEEPDDLDLGVAITPPQEPVFAEQPAVEEKITDEFVPLDEELTFEETVAAPPAPPAAPELPGEISSELLAEPVAATPPAAPEAAGKEKIAPGTQQEIPFDEPAPLIIERQPSTREARRKAETKPEPALENPVPDVPGEPAAQNLEAPPEEAPPAIEVRETFDDSAYFDVEAPLAISPMPEEIVAPAVEPPPAPEATVREEADRDGEKPASEPEVAPMPETAPATELKLEIAEEPAAEIPPRPALVDFDSIDLTLPAKAPGPSSAPVETASTASEPPKTEPGVQSMPSIDFEAVSLGPDMEKPASFSPSETAPATSASEPAAADETAATPEATPEVTLMKKPPDEIKDETAEQPEKAADEKAAPPASADEKHATETPTPESSPPAAPTFKLDDIPVLHEVVAPPAGSMLTPPAPPPAPLPAPDRARDIVVRAVAKLNVEMRKSGGAGLDTKTILRLQKLMRQELEKDGEK